jgi:hypothetical protein
MKSKFLKIFVFYISTGICCCQLFADSNWSDSPVFDLNLLSIPSGETGEYGWSESPAFNLNLLSVPIDGTGDFPSGSSTDFTLDLLWVRRAWADSGNPLIPEIPSVKAEGADELHRRGITGIGTKIGIIEGSTIDLSCPLFGSGYISYSGGYGLGLHPTQVAAVAAGNGQTFEGNYVGMAPLAQIVSAGGIPLASLEWHYAVHIDNHSLANEQVDVIVTAAGINRSTPPASNGNYDAELILDHVIDSHLISVVTAAGNLDETPGGIPGVSGGFNTVVVAAADNDGDNVWDRVWQQNVPPTTADGRCKPDILAPGTWIRVPYQDETNQWHHADSAMGTSVSAPHVAGAVALLSQVAKEQAVPNTWKNPMVIKSVLMTSADKLLGENIDQKPWRHTITQPLDLAQGAGLLNAEAAYELYAHGEREPGQVPTNGWDLGYITGNSEQNYQMNSTLNPGDQMIATLVWNRHVNDQYQASALIDLRLELRCMNSGATVDFSDSSVDNVEHITYTIPYGQGGIYKLRVRNLSETEEDYGLAWRIVKQGIDTPRNLVSNGDFGAGNLSGWITQGNPIVVEESEGYGNFNCARLQNEDLIRQFITLPSGVSLAFDYRFDGVGVLDIYFGNDLLEGGVISATDANLHRKRLDLRQQLANYAGQRKDLQLYFIGDSGFSVYLDNICVTGDPAIEDFDHNGIVDYVDLAELVSHWLKNQPSVDIAPQPNGDGIINLKDFAELVSHWLEGTSP